MTVGELISELKGFDPELPVCLALQPSYPMVHYISDVQQHEMATGEWDGEEEVTEQRVFIAETGSNDYGCPREIFG